MFDEFTQNRIAQLREQKGVSARDMSLSLGQNATYVNKIENRKALPSLHGLFYICEYLGVSPKDFFDEGVENPARLGELAGDLRKLSSSQLSSVSAVVKEFLR